MRPFFDAVGHVPLDHPAVGRLKGRLSVRNQVYLETLRSGRYLSPDIPKWLHYWKEEKGMLLVPRMAAIEAVQGIEDRTTLGDAVTMPSRITLRLEQVGFVDTLEQTLRRDGGTVGQAIVGFGKTQCSLELASRLGRKTLVLVHKSFLATQWAERIVGGVGAKVLLKRKGAASTAPPTLGVSIEDVGIVQQDTWQWEGRKIVIAMVQTLAIRDLPEGFAESFGLVIVDETHRAACDTIQTVLDKLPAKYRLGVSATPTRKDGLEDVFFASIGQVGAVGTVERAKPRFNILGTAVTWDAALAAKLSSGGQVSAAKLVGHLCEHPIRNQQIINQLVLAVKNGRKVIVFSGRREHLIVLREMFLARCLAEQLPISTDFYVGGMKDDARKIAETMQVLFATFSMAEEALDVPLLDTAFLCTPKTSVVQSVGRILRTVPGKKTPVVTDFVDRNVPMCRGMATKRWDAYVKEGWAA